MGEGAVRTVSCVYGAIRFEVVSSKLGMDVRHSAMCQRRSGGAFTTVSCGRSLFVTRSGDVSAFRSSGSSECLSRGTCGSGIVWRLQNGLAADVSVQAIDETEGFAFTEEMFVDDKPDTYAAAHHIHKLTGAEVMAQFPNEQGA